MTWVVYNVTEISERNSKNTDKLFQPRGPLFVCSRNSIVKSLPNSAQKILCNMGLKI
jgi:hypothetical protein